MATIKYYLRNQSVYMRFNLSSRDKIQLSTGLKANPKQWNAKDGFPKKNNAENKQLVTILQNLERTTYERYTIDITSQKVIDTEWLKGVFDIFFNRKKGMKFIDYIDKYIENAPLHRNKKGGVGLSSNSVRSYVFFKKIFLNFENQQNKKFDFYEITNKVANDFKTYLLKKGYSSNSLNLWVSKLNAICNYAESLGETINIKTQAVKTKMQRKETEQIVTLSFEELNKIKSLTNLSPLLHYSRQWLLLGCEIGQRSSDLLKLTINDIKGSEDNLYFELKQVKTNKKIFVPLTKNAKEIVKDFPIKLNYRTILKNFKKVCKLAEIDTPVEILINKNGDVGTNKKVVPKYQAIGTHTCRRSFATNYYGKIPTSLIKAVTGHATEEMLLAYIGKTPEDNLQMLFDIYKQSNI